MSNVIEVWLYLIGNSERARKLRMRVDGLVPPPLDELYGPEPCQCPTTVLFGANVARKLYVDPVTRPALDAWDTGMVSKADIRRYCLDIERSKYHGPIFNPDDTWLKSVGNTVSMYNNLATDLINARLAASDPSFSDSSEMTQ